MMIATDFTRDDCLLGNKRVGYDTLTRDYRCNTCGGRLTMQHIGAWCVACALCKGHDFIHGHEIARQTNDAHEVLDGLPPELAEMFRPEETERKKMTLDEYNALMHPAPIEL